MLQPPPINKWIHLGEYDGAPRGFVGQLLTLVGCPNLDCDVVRGEIQLEGLWEFESAWEFVRYLDKHGVWSIRFFAFANTCRPLGTIKGSRCSVKELPYGVDPNQRCVRFWNCDVDIDRARRTYQSSLALAARRMAKTGVDTPQHNILKVTTQMKYMNQKHRMGIQIKLHDDLFTISVRPT